MPFEKEKEYIPYEITQAATRAKNDNAKAGAAVVEPNEIETRPAIKTETVNRTDWFAYDRKRWDASNGPRVAVLAGPHKTGSSSIQQFVFRVTGLTVKMQPGSADHSVQQPDPVIDWAFPMAYSDEAPHVSWCRFAKSHAGLASLVTLQPDDTKLDNYFPAKPLVSSNAEARNAAVDYYRRLLRYPWEDGKKIVIATENLDAMSPWPKKEKSDLGEETYVMPRASRIIEKLLALLPWDDDGSTTMTDGISKTTRNDNNNAIRPAPLQLQDIEVQLSLRLPRFDHLASMWRQAGRELTLRDFLIENAVGIMLIDSLGLALQYVREGLKTTIIDTSGVYEHEKMLEDYVSDQRSQKKTKKTSWIVGGQEGVIACDVLRMGRESGLCDDESRLHLPFNPNLPGSQNARSDQGNRDLTTDQVSRIERTLIAYDCGVWQHLRKYQEQGLFRILYPSKDLFSLCEPGMNNRNVTLVETMINIKRICLEDNGIARTRPKKKKKGEKKRKERSKQIGQE